MRLFSHHIAAHFHCPVTGRKLNIRKLRKVPDGHIWDYSLGTEWGRLLTHGTRYDAASVYDSLHRGVEHDQSSKPPSQS